MFFVDFTQLPNSPTTRKQHAASPETGRSVQLMTHQCNDAGLEGQAQAVAAIHSRRYHPIAINHTKPISLIRITTTTIHTLGFVIRTCADRIDLCILGVVITIILAPLNHVAIHVVQSQFVRCLGGHYLGAIIRDVIQVPCHIIDVVAAGIGIALTAVAAPSRVLPLGFGG